MKNIIVRSLSGAVYVGLIIGSIFLHKAAFAFVMLFFNVVALYEFYKFREQSKDKTIRLLILAVLIFVLHHLVISDFLESKWLWLIGIVPIVIASHTLFTYQKTPEYKISYALLGLLYITLPLMLLNQLNIQNSDGASPIVLVGLILIWVNDSFAYLTGMAIGKHKLFERISPKKTWEGFAGGVIATLIAAWFFFSMVSFESRLQWIILAGLISVASVVGDFVESMFKRSAGVKDSGNMIPGHGGVLDRIDSILFVFPIVFIYLQLI